MKRWVDIRNCSIAGIERAWYGFVWMLKIIVPVSFLTSFIEYAGFLEKIDFILEPVMAFIHLPPEAALPLGVGLLSGIYGGIAAMVMLPFTTGQMTLMAIFLLIAHNLIQEGIVQAKTGLHFITATLVRLLTAVAMVLLVAPFIGTETIAVVSTGTFSATPLSVASHLSVTMVLYNWLSSTLVLCAKMLMIITLLMIFIEILKHYDVIRHVGGVMRPVVRILGLNESAVIIWLTAVIFGLTYGAAVIVEDVQSGRFEPAGLKRLQISIGINHAMIEDPLLFIALGIHPLFLWLPRLVAAMTSTHLLALWQKIIAGRHFPISSGRKRLQDP